jgi:hypothetical protein
LVEKLEVSEIVNIDLLFQNNHHSVIPKSHGTYLRPEWNLLNAPALVVIPNHHCRGWVARVAPSTNNS